MARCGRTSQVVDLIDFQPERMDDVVPDQLEVRPGEQMADIGLLTGEEIVEADDVVPLGNRPFAKMGPESRRRR